MATLAGTRNTSVHQVYRIPRKLAGKANLLRTRAADIAGMREV
ncbi:MAG: hypothetical protein U1B80_00145 [Anaerolineaceae bacterium]|nr:hypothetical protein [Anaerolineaceae bacterium]